MFVCKFVLLVSSGGDSLLFLFLFYFILFVCFFLRFLLNLYISIFIFTFSCFSDSVLDDALCFCFAGIISHLISGPFLSPSILGPSVPRTRV